MYMSGRLLCMQTMDVGIRAVGSVLKSMCLFLGDESSDLKLGSDSFLHAASIEQFNTCLPCLSSCSALSIAPRRPYEKSSADFPGRSLTM